MARVVLAMSGGVDSSVAAHLLRDEGHDVVGVFMRHGEESIQSCATADGGSSAALPLLTRADHKQGCCSAVDAEDARRVADQMDIPFYALDLQADFRRIVDYFCDEYTSGRTPNPCVVCNSWIKFGRLFEYADSVDADFIATGHYARRIQDEKGVHRLCCGVDSSKDQSYALFGIDRSFLPRVLLPVGRFEKRDIRGIATDLDLRVADKAESQEICFVTSGKHDEFVRSHRRGHDTSGSIVTTDGRIVGQHTGIERFTVGQRKGLGVALGVPHFVLRIEADTCMVVIGAHNELSCNRLVADRTNWLVDVPDGPFRCCAKIRYNSMAVAATAEVLPDRRLSVVFDEPRFGVAPGQAVVCYDGDHVLGGGWIE